MSLALYSIAIMWNYSVEVKFQFLNPSYVRQYMLAQLKAFERGSMPKGLLSFLTLCAIPSC